MKRTLRDRSNTVWVGLCIGLVAVGCARATDLPPEKYKESTQEREIFVPTRDGVHLSTTVVRPKDAAGKLPAILVRAPFDDTSKFFGAWLSLDFYVKHGYAVVLQDERGRGFSEGYYQNFLQNASSDGYDTIDWIVKQPWSNGKVATIGCSSCSAPQWPMAAANHPGHAAMIAAAERDAVGNVPGNETRGNFYRGGVPLFEIWASWYGYATPSERLVLPPNSTQEQRIRLRNNFSTEGPYWLFRPPYAAAAAWSGWSKPSPPAESELMHLPSKDILRQLGGPLTAMDKYLTWTPGDTRWNEVGHVGTGAKPRVPALHVDTWNDGGAGETTRLYKYLQDLGTPNQYLIIGAGPHCAMFKELFPPNQDFSKLKFGDLEMDARYAEDDNGYQNLFLNWYEYWLKGVQNHVTDMPRVQLYVMGKGWISGDHWPLKQARFTEYYLSGNPASRPSEETGTLMTRPPSRDEKDSYTYDPNSAVPSGSDEPDDAINQRSVEDRKDVLVYRTPRLDKPVTLAGPIDVVLYVSSSAKDTDFMVRLIDVYPDGRAIALSGDAFRVRYREGFDKKVLMQPGNVYKITLSNMVTAIRFPKGHRIGLQVSSSDFPMYERNLNTGGNNYDETTWVVAENSIHHGQKYPSHVLLPVLPE